MLEPASEPTSATETTEDTEDDPSEVTTTEPTTGSPRKGWRLAALLGAGAALSAASLVQAVGNFGFHIFSTRLLGPAEYARLGALLNLVMLAAVPLVAVQLAATMAVARTGGADQNLQKVHRRLIQIAVIAGGVLAAATPLVDAFFKINDPRITLLAAPYIAVSVLAAGWRGVAIGRDKIRTAAWSFLVTPVVRLGIGVPLLYAGAGVIGAMAATVGAEIAAAVVLATSVRSGTGQKTVLALRTAGSSAVMLTGLWLFFGVDVFVAVRVLDATAAGEYLAIAALARTALMVPQMLAAVGVRHWAAGGDTTQAQRGGGLKQMAVMWAGVGAVGTFVFWMTAEWWLGLLFGAGAYSSAAAQVATLMVGAAAVGGVATMAAFYFQAQGDRRSQAAWVGAVAVLAALIVEAASGTTATGLAVVRLAVVAPASVALLAVALRACGRSQVDLEPNRTHQEPTESSVY